MADNFFPRCRFYSNQKMRSTIFFITCFLLSSALLAQSRKQLWVDSVYNTLDESGRIGQLFMLPVSSADDEANTVERFVRSHNIGGVLFTTGDALNQVQLTNELQAESDVPLLIGFDAVQGLGHFLQNAIEFPPPLALAAISDDSLVLETSKEIGRQLSVMGVNLNLGPTANLHDNMRQAYDFELFGEEKFAVSQKLKIYLRGLQSQGILSCARHFPVQGVTITDIEKGIPVIHPFVDSVAAYPFQQLFNAGVEAVMPAAHELPVFYEKKKAARRNKLSSSMLSSFFAGDWIKKEMKYNGLVIVDIRTLESASRKLKNADAELFAFQAGNDILLTNNNPGPAIRKIRRLLKKEKQYAVQLENSVKKILAAKYDAGLFNREPIPAENLLLRINTPEAKVLQQRAAKASITVTKNENNTLPILALENKNFATVVIGDTTGTRGFTHMVNKYVPAKHFNFNYDEYDSALMQEQVNRVLQRHQTVVILIPQGTRTEKLDKILPLLKPATEQNLIVVDCGNYGFQKFLNSFSTVVQGFSSQSEIIKAIPQVIFGGLPGSGQLPISMGTMPPGRSVATNSLKRFEYSIPEDAGLSSKRLEEIDAIAQEAINIGGTPGCHVLVARKGKVVFEKSYGFLTYEKQIPVTDSTLYDLASITKVSATLQAVMFLYDRGMIDIHKKVAYYLPELKTSNKRDATVKDVLTHQAGLWPFLPFWAQTMKDTSYIPTYYSRKPSNEYPFVVSDRLFASRSMKDSLWNWIIKAKVREKPARTPFDYKYSDMGFYILQHLSEKLLNQPMEDFLDQNLYEPLGAHTTGYLPLLRYPVSRIAPTENDRLFRRSLLIGTVHDQGAAMHGGVAGHAGLFSTANDLAKLGQMLLQEGYYGGYQYYKPETVRLFTQKQYRTSRRGLGWDKPVQSDPNSPTGLFASPATFGHTGFTGTCIWVDPEFDLVYIFLSNRVHPDMSNTKLLTANIRTRIQDVVYQSVFDFCKTKTPETGVIEEPVKSASR